MLYSAEPAVNASAPMMSSDATSVSPASAFFHATTAAMKILDAQLGKTQYVAGPSFSYGDIPVGIMCYRFVQLVPQRPSMPNLDRWYGAISSRQAFKDHVGSVPLS